MSATLLLLIGEGVLAVAGMIAAFWGLYLNQKYVDDSNDRRFRLWTICALFISASALLTPLSMHPGSGAVALAQLVSNFAYFVSMPLMALLVLSVGRNWRPGGRVWGRILLAPIVAFIAARQFGYGIQYTQLIAILSVLLGLGATISLTAIKARALMAAATAGFAVTLVCSNPYGLWPRLDSSLVALIGAIVLLMGTYAIHIQMQMRQSQ